MAAGPRGPTTTLTMHAGVLAVVRRSTEPEARARLIHTAKILALVDDPTLECLLALEHDAVSTVLVTRFAGGSSLASRRPSDPRVLAHVAAELCTALARLHAAGIVHGPIAPAHVVLTTDTRPVLCDFTDARLRTSESPEAWRHACGDDVRSVGILVLGILGEPATATRVDPITRLHRRRITRAARSIGDAHVHDTDAIAERFRRLTRGDHRGHRG